MLGQFVFIRVCHCEVLTGIYDFSAAVSVKLRDVASASAILRHVLTYNVQV